MYSISIAMGRGTPVVWALMYRTEARALETFKILQENVGDVVINDDYGQTIAIKKADVIGMMFEDYEQSRMAHIERAVHEQKIRAAIGQRVRSDPGLRDIVQPGPAMLGIR